MSDDSNNKRSEQRASLSEAGFLSPDIAEWIAEHRAAHAASFYLAERLNRTVMSVAESAPIATDHRRTADPKFLAYLLLLRTLSNFQGVILMAERGMVVEARTLARSCYENLFCAAALKAGDSGFVQELLNDELASRKGRAKFILGNTERLKSASPEQREELAKHLAEWEARGKSRSLDYRKAAETGGFPDLYVVYRQFAADAAHPSVSSLSRYVVPGEQDEEVRYVHNGPGFAAGEIGDTVNWACSAVILCCAIVADMHGMSDALGPLHQLQGELKAMEADSTR